MERVRALPAVSNAAYVSYPPLVFKGGRSYTSIEGRPAPPREDFFRYMASDGVVSTGYFSSISPVDPTTFAATALVLTLMAGVASYVPARRSANIDPVSVLRAE